MVETDTQPTPTTTLARREDEPTWKVADSLESSSLGEVMLLDRHGHVLSPRQTRWAITWGWLRVGTLGASLGILGAALFGSLGFGLLMAATFSGAVGWQLRHQPALKRALALAAAGRRDEAREAFEELERRNPPSAYRPTIDIQLGGILWLQGHHREALDRYGRALATYENSRRHKSHPGYWICAFNRVQLLACSGKVDAAIARAPSLDDAPEGEYFRMERIATDLLIAFYSDQPERLPEDLYDWARDVLSMNRMGISAVILAWAFHRRGDDDMARHMLREAPERLEGYYLEDSAPAVHAWMEEKLAEWPVHADEEAELL